MKNQPLKILAITSEVPWPLNSGGHLRSFHLLRELSRSSSLRVIVPASKGQAEHFRALDDQGVNVIPVLNCDRKKHREAGSIIQSCLEREPYVFFRRHYWKAVQCEIRKQIRIEKPDLIYLDHLDSFVYRKAIDEIPFLVDMHNVYSAISQRLAEEDSNIARRMYLKHETRLIKNMESQMARSALAVLAVSDLDRDHFIELGATSTFMIPNGVDCDSYVQKTTHSESNGTPSEILFVGDLSWSPNIRASLFLANHVYPIVRAQHHDAKLTIVGRNPVPEILALNQQQGVEVVPDAPEIIPYFHRSTMLAVPLQSGGGTRLKILEAFASQLPVVSTPVGCEGLDVVNGKHLVVSESDNFADAICQVINKPELATAYSAYALKLVKQQYDWKSVGRRLMDSIQEIVPACKQT